VKRLAAIACLVGLAGMGQAQPFEPEGLYLFHTTEQRPDLNPVCSELWEFGPNGQFLVESGAERVEHRYRIETDRSGVWLVTTPVKTNGKADCVGHENPAPSPEERRMYLVPMNDGRVATCPAPSLTETGVPFVSGCFGFMVPADQAG
jgi:hypothetical protein